MNYRIVGTDGKTYGPVGLPEIRQWIVQRRVEARTPVHVEGAVDWTYLGLLPELAADFAAPPSPIGAVTPVTPQRANSLATAGFICGLLAWTCCCFPIGLVGLILSIVALVQIGSAAQPQGGRGLAITGLVLSAAQLLFAAGLALLNLVMPNGNFNWQLHFP
jgi:hypothetical protein